MFERVLSAVLGKKYEIIAILCKNADENGLIRLSIADICALCNASKPTVINALHFLEEKKGGLDRLPLAFGFFVN